MKRSDLMRAAAEIRAARTREQETATAKVRHFVVVGETLREAALERRALGWPTERTVLLSRRAAIEGDGERPLLGLRLDPGLDRFGEGAEEHVRRHYPWRMSDLGNTTSAT